MLKAARSAKVAQSAAVHTPLGSVRLSTLRRSLPRCSYFVRVGSTVYPSTPLRMTEAGLSVTAGEAQCDSGGAQDDRSGAQDDSVDDD